MNIRGINPSEFKAGEKVRIDYMIHIYQVIERLRIRFEYMDNFSNPYPEFQPRFPGI
jgi:hypothetical protein